MHSGSVGLETIVRKMENEKTNIEIQKIYFEWSEGTEDHYDQVKGCSVEAGYNCDNKTITLQLSAHNKIITNSCANKGLLSEWIYWGTISTHQGRGPGTSVVSRNEQTQTDKKNIKTYHRKSKL